MYKIKIGLLLAAVTVLLSACSVGGPTDPDTTENKQTKDAQTQSGSLDSIPPTSAEDPDTIPPREGMARSRLTNEWVDQDVADTRPIAVITPNESQALPQYSLADASILYEANVEGYMSRLLAIYEDWDQLEKIGNVRSLRSYYAYWAFEWDAFIIHSGYPFFVDELLAEPTTQTVNEGDYSDSAAFFRDESRPRPHNAYAVGSGILDVINDKGYSLKYRGIAEANHFNFAEASSPNTLSQYGDDAKSAVYIDMSGCYPLTRCYFDYNEQEGLYYRSQHLSGSTDGPHLDASGTQLAFKNILVQYVKYVDLGEGYLAFQCNDDTEDGWYFTNGKGIHITWKKSEDYGATRYYDDNGNEIELNTGKTMVCIALKGNRFTFR